jgi:recombination protein RecT
MAIKQAKTEAQPVPAPTTVQTMAPNKQAIMNFETHILNYEKKVLPSLLEKHGISPTQFVQVVLSEIKKNEKLLKAFMENPSSMFASILAGAEIGLIPSDMIGEFYLIPRNLKQADGKYRMSVTPMIGYKGLHSILLRSGDVAKIHTEVVYEGDEFTPIYGLEPNIVHKPNFDVPRTADKIKYAYAVAKMKNGEYQFAVMTRAEIQAVQNLAKDPNQLYFNDKMGINRWMERKCVLIQLAKMLPKDYYSKKAISMDGMVEGGAMLTLDENNQVKIVEGAPVKPTRYRNIYGTLLADSKTDEPLPEIEQGKE